MKEYNLPLVFYLLVLRFMIRQKIISLDFFCSEVHELNKNGEMEIFTFEMNHNHRPFIFASRIEFFVYSKRVETKKNRLTNFLIYA